MKKEYIKVASIPDGERIVSTTIYGGGYYWNWVYPFKHYKSPSFIVATDIAIYKLNTTP
jgi:hypothetical protein